MNRRSFLARFVGGLAAISLRLEEMPKANEYYKEHPLFSEDRATCLKVYWPTKDHHEWIRLDAPFI